MKKLLLGLATLSLTALPVLTIVSCGGSTDGGTTTPDPETTTDLRITTKPSIQSTIDKAIIDFNASGATPADKIAALQTVFNGITETNFKNFEVKATAGTPGTIILTAKSGFSFGTSATLSQNLVLDLGISPIRVAQTVINKAITDFNVSGATEANKIAALSTVFAGITSENFKNFEVKATPTAGSIAGTITLTAKEGFIFGASKTLSSWSLDENFDLKITATPSTQPTIDKAIADFNASGAPEVDKITALKTIFEGITTENFKNFDVTATAGTPGTIVLRAKPGFNFNGQPTLISISTSTPVVDLKITAKQVIQSVITAAIQSINDTPTEANKITALSTVFAGITATNFNNFDEAFLGTSPNQKIVLTAKSGFNFGGQPTLTSIPKEIVKLPISRKPVFNQSKINTATRLISGEGATAASTVGALELVFDGVTIENFKNITVELSQPGGIRRIVLIAKEGYGFSKGETSISSDAVKTWYMNEN